MICITGDMHGELSRFDDKKIKALKKGDVLIVCGDFGFVWEDTKREDSVLKRIGRKSFYTLFVDGCHENFSLLEKYPDGEFCGGKVKVISGNLMYMKRGSIFTLQGYRFFAFGGGQTKEIDIRRESKTWHEQELPSTEEIRQAALNIKNEGNSVDYIVTHEPPASIKEFLGFEVNQISHMHTFFDAVKNDCEFKMWFFGKAHINKVIPPKYHCLFDEVVVLRNERWEKEQKMLKSKKQLPKVTMETDENKTVPEDSFE